jgi:hypothetical protein
MDLETAKAAKPQQVGGLGLDITTASYASFALGMDTPLPFS